ncbi:MAG: hypothetical protein EP329_21005 [Deltaproteobacteria bacterium]|nr:MAG: hypothetical protein EP329_21005 [Deltaproteobacteria bacterium]
MSPHDPEPRSTPRSGKASVRRVAVAALSSAQIDAMWRLYEEFYANVDRASFDADLAGKDFVLLGTDSGSGELAGFSTVLFFEVVHEGRRVGFYFTGDTVFHPRYWGQKGLHWATLREWIRWKLRHPTTPLYWYLICSGHRTYLSLVRNFPTHWPHHLRPTPAFELGLLDVIGRRFGEAWHPERGLIAVDGPQPVLKAEVAPITAELRALPEIELFLRLNPGHAEGDELAMIALVDGRAVRWMIRRWLTRARSGRRRTGERRR